MDSPCDAPPKWAEKKDTYKSGKYTRHRNFIEHLSEKRGISWTCQQANFSVGVRGSIRTVDFEDRLKQLGVESGKDCKDIRTNAIFKTLDLTDSLLTLFFIAAQKSPQWMFESIDTEFANSYTQRYNIDKRFTGPLIGLS